jgi:Concanavalin A-like lectin/glucanases superfamily
MGVSMKLLAVSFLTMSSLALVAAGCGTDESDDVSAANDALLTCGGLHHNPESHRGHHHHRHHHHGGGGTTGAAGTSGMAGTTGAGGGDMGGTTGTGGSGGMIDPACIPPDGAVSWWHGDGDFDDAVGTNDGNNAGGVSFGTGIDQQGFSLNQSAGSFVEVPNDPSLQFTDAITIDAWINTSVFGGRIVDKITAFGSDGFLMDMGGDQVRLIVAPDNFFTNSHVPAGIWTHVAATFDASTMAIYYNGVNVGSAPTSGPHTIPINANTLRIGADSTGGSMFNGMIDEPRIFSRALSAAEIQTLFWQGTNCP